MMSCRNKMSQNENHPKSRILINFGAVFLLILSTTSLRAAIPKPNQQDPMSFLNQRLSAMIREIDLRPVTELHDYDSLNTETIEIKVSADKNSWLNALYKNHLIEASPLTKNLSDKLLQHKIFSHYLQTNPNTPSQKFLLHSIGLKEFLVKHKLINAKGQLKKDVEAFEVALANEFPKGFIVRPTVGIAPQESFKGMFANSDQFIRELFKEKSPLYQAENLNHPIKSHILKSIASGESIVLQEDFIRSSNIAQKSRFKTYERVRIHTYEGHIIENAEPKLWVMKRSFEITPALQNKAEEFTSQFLSSLPSNFIARQAWAVDVLVMPSGDMKILDILTNRGYEQAWSSYIEQPQIIKAYTRHFEKHYGIKFIGAGGFLSRNGLANFGPYKQKSFKKCWSHENNTTLKKYISAIGCL